MRNVLPIVLNMVMNNVLRCAVIAQIFVLYVQDLKQGVHNIQKTYVLYVLKFAKHVLMNVLNTLRIMKVAKLALKLVKNVLKLVRNTELKRALSPSFFYKLNG